MNLTHTRIKRKSPIGEQKIFFRLLDGYEPAAGLH